MMPKTSTISISDDHPHILHSLKQLFSSVEGFNIVSESTNGKDLLTSLLQHPTDLAITDFALSTHHASIEGVAKLRLLKEKVPNVRLILLTSQNHPAILMKAFDYGVRAIVSKSDPVEEILRACQGVMQQGGRYLSPTISLLKNEYDSESSKDSALTPKEFEVVRLFSSGCSLAQIAARQNRTISTISTQKYNAMRRLGITSNTELIRYAYSLGII